MIKKFVNLLFEGLHLKRIKHEWIRFAWVTHPDSIAEHSLIAAQIWYVLAKMEWADSNKVTTMLVWHDIAETRIWDLHKVATKYITNKDKLEEDIMKEQFEWFDFRDEILEMFKEYENGTTLEGKIAKDADLLEQAFQCREHVENWFSFAQGWIDNVGKSLQTKSAKQVFNEILKSSFTDWWSETKLKNIKWNS